jgi:hypothetical protein
VLPRVEKWPTTSGAGGPPGFGLLADIFLLYIILRLASSNISSLLSNLLSRITRRFAQTNVNIFNRRTMSILRLPQELLAIICQSLNVDEITNLARTHSDLARLLQDEHVCADVMKASFVARPVFSITNDA